MILYHGSNIDFDTIELLKSKKYKDFNRAFYLSSEENQALALANNKCDFLGGTPIVQKYEFDESLLTDGSLNVKIFEHYSVEWAEFIWNNRDEKQDYKHSFDIVYGPIANDTIGVQMREFRRSHLSLEEFLQGLKYSRGETFQYAFCTNLAISKLNRIWE